MIRLKGLYYITNIKNLSSILKKGILSHNAVINENLTFQPIYDSEVMQKRKKRKLNGKSLWNYANLYFQPRNPMLYRLIYMEGNPEENLSNIIIIGVKRTILGKKGIFVTTGNAANNETEFYLFENNKQILKKIKNETDREWWNTENGTKRKIIAECLIPDKVEPAYIEEIYVANEETKYKVQEIIKNLQIHIIVEPELFFQPAKELTLTENLSLVYGDMFLSRMQTLTISVNTVGVMGKGVASRAKYQFPDVYVYYQDLCKTKKLKMGKPCLYKREQSLESVLAEETDKLTQFNMKTWFLLFPTKRHWRENSDPKGIIKGLEWLLKNYQKEGIKSLALPALGCGLGNLKWEDMGPVMCQYLSQMNIPVKLYLPMEKKIPEEQLKPEFLLNKKRSVF